MTRQFIEEEDALEPKRGSKREPLHAALTPFFDDGLIYGSPIVVKSGKEATVYRCQATPSTGREFLAAKIYRPRQSRSFKNDAVYREGRVILDTHAARAVKNKSRKGREIEFEMWLGHEYETLKALYAAGADVPKPHAHTGNALLLDYVGDGARVAPQLADVALSRAEADLLFDVILQNIELWLKHNQIHADLSAYNILYWEGRVTIIDFPQSVDPRFNPNARALLEHDITSLCDYFAEFGIQADAARIARQLWSRFQSSNFRV